MKLPKMRYGSGIRKRRQIVFGGLNQTLGAGDGELRDMKNLTSEHYPVLSSRAPRALHHRMTEPGGIFSWKGKCWVDGDVFYYEGEEKGRVTPGQKQFAAMGSYIVVFPDKCYFNVATNEFGSMESRWKGRSVHFENGVLFEEEAAANTIHCSDVDWTQYFKIGDAVTISGCTVCPANNKTLIIRDIDGDRMYFYEHSFTLGDDETYYLESNAITIERTVPDLKFLCENDNRLWGCTEDTIYACKLGDIFNWNVYDGVDTDAYAVGTGSSGVFTGCVCFAGQPVFFKEDHIYKIYGSVPSNFEVVGSNMLGVAEGSGQSIAVAGNAVYYLSPSGVAVYTGGMSYPVGQVFGETRFRNATAGSDGLKYYISMETEAGAWGLYVYDTQRGLWHKEDEKRIYHFARWDGFLCFLDDQGKVWSVGSTEGSPGAEEENLEWMAEFSDFTEDEPNKKGISKLQLRLELDEGASMTVFMMFDSDGTWHKVSSIPGESRKRSYYLPIIPRRCDHYRVKLTGTGGCRIYSMAREYYTGSELRSTTGRN